MPRSSANIQYLFPIYPLTALKTYLSPIIGAGFTVIEETPIIGSPKSGSACSNPRNSYLSEVIPD
jgi:hypothetical protein